jgi:phosphohistidine swiveling domain-containing protein
VDISLAALAGNEPHLAEEVARVQPDLLTHHFDLHAARRDEVHRVGVVAVTNELLPGNCEPRPQQARDGIELHPGELGKYRHLGNELPGLKTEIETGPDLDLGAGDLHLAAQGAIQLWTNHAVFEQGAVFHVFAAQPTRHREGGDWRALPADSPFRQSFESFIERYGHRGIYESYLRNPRWRERPGYLLDNLQALAQTDLEALAATRQATATVAMARVRNALPWWQRPLLKPLLRSANVQSNDREAARSALVAYSEPGRRTMPAIGARWVERGWLADPNDIFFLLGEEIVDALEGKLDGTGLAARVEDRRIQFDAWMTETPADVILEDAGKVFIPEAAKESIRMEGQDCFIGVAVGSGCATGKARLLRSPEEGVRLGNGDILVVPSTDPAWTPLFLRAGGLVMETGGYLSHGAIVAREFGIPAVVNLPGILHHLQDGDVVEVDGGRGLVRRLRQ